MPPAIAATRPDSGSMPEKSRITPQRYQHYVVSGQVISEPIDQISFDTSGRILVPSLPH